jgi:hypothetical protein
MATITQNRMTKRMTFLIDYRLLPAKDINS